MNRSLKTLVATCLLSVAMTLSVFAQGGLEITGPTPVCIDDAQWYTLHQVPAGTTITWQTPGGEVMDLAQNDKKVLVHWLDPGMHTLTAVLQSGEDPPVLVQYAVDVQPIPQISLDILQGNICLQSENLQTCTNQTFTLTANTNEDVSYLWTVTPASGYVISDPEAQTVNLTFTEAGTFAICVSVETSAGCEAQSCKIVQVDAQPEAYFEVVDHPEENPVMLCEGDRLFFEAQAPSIGGNSPAYYYWTLTGPGGTFSHSGKTANEWNWFFDTPGAYEVCLQVEGRNCQCLSEKYCITVVVEEGCRPPIICPSVVCEGARVEYCVDESWGCTGFTWTVEGGTIVSQPEGGRCVVIVWDDPGPGGYGILNLEVTTCDACPDLCPGPHSIKVPVIPAEVDITGESMLCEPQESGTTYPKFSVPFYPGATYTWSFTSLSPNVTLQNQSANANYFSPVIDYLGEGSFEVSCHIQHPVTGCETTGSLTSTIHIGKLSGTTTYCEGNDFAIFTWIPTPPTPFDIIYTLTDNNGNIVLTGQQSDNAVIQIPLSGLPFGQFSLTAEVAGLCSSNKFFNYNDLPEIPIIKGPTVVCQGETVMYEVEGNYLPGSKYSWTFPFPAPGIFIGPKNQKMANIIWNTNGTITVSVEKSGCKSVGSLAVAIGSPTPPVVTGPATVCPGEEVIYTFAGNAGTGIQWTIEPSWAGTVIAGNGTQEAHVIWNKPVSSPASAAIQVQYTYCGQTVASAPFAVTIQSAALAIGLPDPVCAGEEGAYTLSPDVPGSATTWWMGDGTIHTGAPNALNHTYGSSGNYTITVVQTQPSGCEAFGEEIVTVGETPEGYIIAQGRGPCPQVPGPWPPGYQMVLSPVLSGGPFASYAWYKLPTNLLVGTSVEYTITKNKELGDYRLVVTTTEGCTAEFYASASYGCTTFDPCLCDSNLFDLHIDAVNNFGCGNFQIIGVISPFFDDLPALDFLVKEWRFQTENGVEIIPMGSGDPIDDPGLLFQPRTYTQAGIYAAELYAQYTCLEEGSATQRDTCEKSDIAFVTVPLVADVSATVTCDGEDYQVLIRDRSTILPIGTITARVWTLDGVEQSAWEDEAIIQATFTPGPNPVTYTVCLQAEANLATPDELCSACTQFTIPASTTINIAADGGCTDEEIQFSSTALSDPDVVWWEWTVTENNNPVVSSNEETPKIVFSDPGTYYVSLVVYTSDGCARMVEEPFVVIENTIMGGISVTSNECVSEVLLTYDPQTPGYEYSWSTGGIGPSILINQSGHYYLTITNAEGCHRVFDQMVVAGTEAFESILSGDPLICINSFGVYTFQGVEGYTYVLETDYPFPPTISKNPTTQVGAFTISPGNNPATIGHWHFTVVAMKNGEPCGSLEIEMDVLPLPVPPQLDVEYLLCSPFTVQITSDVDVQWTPPIYEFGQEIFVHEGGVYVGKVTNMYGCSVSAQVVVEDEINFNSFLTGCYTFCDSALANGSVSLDGIPGVFDEWAWLPIGTNGQPDYTNPILTGQNSAITSLVLSASYEGEIVLYVKQVYPGGLECEDVSDPFCIIVIECGCDQNDVEYLCTFQPSFYLGYNDQLQVHEYYIQGIVEMANGDFTFCSPYFTVDQGDFDPEMVVVTESPDGEHWYMNIEGIFRTADVNQDEVCLKINLCDLEGNAVDCTAECCVDLEPDNVPRCNVNWLFDLDCNTVYCGAEPHYNIDIDISGGGSITPPGDYLLKISMNPDLPGCLFSNGLFEYEAVISTDINGNFLFATELACIDPKQNASILCLNLELWHISGVGGPICSISDCIDFRDHCEDLPELTDPPYNVFYTCLPGQTGNPVYNVTFVLPELTDIISQTIVSNNGGFTLTSVDSNVIAGNLQLDPANRWLDVNIQATGSDLVSHDYCIRQYLRSCGYDDMPALQGDQDEGVIRSDQSSQRTNAIIDVVPNPTSGRTLFHYSYSVMAGKTYTLELRDALGRRMWYKELNSAKGEIPVQMDYFQKGLYQAVLLEDHHPIATNRVVRQ